MNKDCLDIGIIQAFLDGELRHEESARVSGHIALCDTCASMLADAEEETAFVFPALAREFDTLVPTQRLWNKINDSITTERESRPFWHKVWAFVTVSLTSPSMMAAASLLLVFGIFAALWINKSAMQPGASTNVARTLPVVNTTAAPQQSEPVTDPVSQPMVTQSPKIERAAYRPEPRPVAVENRKPIASSGYMPGEESYVKSIASLNKTVDGQKDAVLRVSERMAFERDMALVNDTIAKMRNEVKRNPKNESAKQVLYSSYQNKLDLLNSVAQKEELVTSLK